MDESVVTPLSTHECWELLEEYQFGRLAFHLAGEVHITPLNYVTHNRESIVFRTSEGHKLLGLYMNSDVAFEIDDVGDGHALSVVARGRAEQLEGSRKAIADELHLRPWVPTEKYNVIGITVTEITGRRFTLGESPDLL